ncbi:MAG: hypothetical protein MRERV_49c009 [Mycoplasmataceae bacterium RV_VA103A]|nr:MAG: hypothetical protein MRERV_49c009 [Mycoplasmataceae bacterium RV_VA103A]
MLKVTALKPLLKSRLYRDLTTHLNSRSVNPISPLTIFNEPRKGGDH